MRSNTITDLFISRAAKRVRTSHGPGRAVRARGPGRAVRARDAYPTYFTGEVVGITRWGGGRR